MSDDNNPSAGRTLDGRLAEPLPSTWARPSSSPRVGRIGNWAGSSSGGRSNDRFGTIDGMNAPPSASSRPPPAAPGDDEDENDDTDRAESWFAGGERSGISVQNPGRSRGVPGGDTVRELLHRAAEAGSPPGSSHSNLFTGGGHRLGSDEQPSVYIPDPDAPQASQATAIRHLTFWRDGFTVEDGELLRYDDPANEQLLTEINSGIAPPSVLNVNPGQHVELRVAKRINEDYVPSRSHTTNFGGAGHRLGAPVPNFGSTNSSHQSTMPGSFPPSSSAQDTARQRESLTTCFEVDQTKPMTSIQLRLADGTRMVCRMNLTHTIQDIRNFINASRPENLTRPYTIGTTFPNRTLDNNSTTIETAGLANSVIVQRWV